MYEDMGEESLAFIEENRSKNNALISRACFIKCLNGEKIGMTKEYACNLSAMSFSNWFYLVINVNHTD